MKKTLAFCFLTLLCGCTQPAPPAASGTPVAATPVSQDFSGIKDKSVKDFAVAPFGGMSAELSGIVGAKLESGKGAYVPMMEASSGNKVLLAFIPGLEPAEADKRAGSGQLKISGQLKPIEDAGLAKAVEGKLGGSLFQFEGKPVYVVLTEDPLPAAGAPATPTAKGTP